MVFFCIFYIFFLILISHFIAFFYFLYIFYHVFVFIFLHILFFILFFNFFWYFYFLTFFGRPPIIFYIPYRKAKSVRNHQNSIQFFKTFKYLTYPYFKINVLSKRNKNVLSTTKATQTVHNSLIDNSSFWYTYIPKSLCKEITLFLQEKYEICWGPF